MAKRGALDGERESAGRAAGLERGIRVERGKREREREREGAEGLEELRQLNHEDRLASELDSAETFGESER